jgi:hypothetical protein
VAKKKFKKILGGVVRAVAAVYTGGASEAMIAAATARRRGGAAPAVDTTELMGSYMPASAQSLVNSYRDVRGQARAFGIRAGFPQRSPAVVALTGSIERPFDDDDEPLEPEEEFDEDLPDEDEEE